MKILSVGDVASVGALAEFFAPPPPPADPT
jgi:hypothetical protein